MSNAYSKAVRYLICPFFELWTVGLLNMLVGAFSTFAIVRIVTLTFGVLACGAVVLVPCALRGVLHFVTVTLIPLPSTLGCSLIRCVPRPGYEKTPARPKP